MGLLVRNKILHFSSITGQHGASGSEAPAAAGISHLAALWTSLKTTKSDQPVRGLTFQRSHDSLARFDNQPPVPFAEGEIDRILYRSGKKALPMRHQGATTTVCTVSLGAWQSNKQINT